MVSRLARNYKHAPEELFPFVLTYCRNEYNSIYANPFEMSFIDSPVEWVRSSERLEIYRSNFCEYQCALA
jgi:hypothetical protein